MLEGMGTNFGAIRRAIKENIKSTKEDSTVEREWPIYDSSLQNFGTSFSKALPQEYTDTIKNKVITNAEEYGEVFKKYIEDTLAQSKNKNLVAIEFGGSGSKLFQGFKKDLFQKTVGVCLEDIRNRSDKNTDESNHHLVIEGDFINGETKGLYSDIEHKLGGKKVDLILSRLMAPLVSMNKNPVLLERIVRNWYSMLNENGIMFAQFDAFNEHRPFNDKVVYESEPEALRISEIIAMDWAMSVMSKFPSIDIQLGRGIIRIHKKEGAPDELPNSKELNTKSNRIII